MKQKGLTVRQAAQMWVNEFDAIDRDMIAKLMSFEPDEWTEVTISSKGEGYCDVLPMWGVMWSFHDPCDTYWLEEADGLQALSECGFRVFYNEEFGYFFGIDGAGYDFYESHWVPLYRARGLQWHDPETEGEKTDE